MGCSDDGSRWAEDASRLKKELDERTAMLCEVLGWLECQYPANPAIVATTSLTSGVKAWWEKHKIADGKRQAEEAAARRAHTEAAAHRARGLAKLSPEERAALGITE